MGKFINKFDQKIQLVDKTNYKREAFQSYMTTTEWRNVEMAEEYATFLREGNSMFQFPYLRQIFELWKVTFKSFFTALKYNSAWQIFSSEYMLMDIFVSIFTTIELIPKAILALIFYPFLKKENTSQMQVHLADHYEIYAKDLQTIPFYDQSYQDIRNDLAQKYQSCPKLTLVDKISWQCVAAELWAREVASRPLHKWFHSDSNIVAATTDILIKFNAKDVDCNTNAEQALRDKLSILSLDHKIELVEQQIFTKTKQLNKDYISVYARLRVPRYAAFQPLIRAMTQHSILLRKIAGQDQVQVKYVATGVDPIDTVPSKLDLYQLRNNTQDFATKNNVTLLYSYRDSIHSNQQFYLLDVPVKQLQDTIQFLEPTIKTKTSSHDSKSPQPAIKVKFIHNF